MSSTLTLVTPHAPRILRRWPLVIAGLLLAVATASAGPKPPRDGFPPMHRLEKALSLTPEQTAAAKAQKDAQREAAKAAKASIRAKRDELRALWAAETPNRAAILAKMNELTAIATTLATARVDARLAFIQTLTAPQKQALARILAEPPPHGKHGKHERGEH